MRRATRLKGIIRNQPQATDLAAINTSLTLLPRSSAVNNCPEVERGDYIRTNIVLGPHERIPSWKWSTSFPCAMCSSSENFRPRSACGT